MPANELTVKLLRITVRKCKPFRRGLTRFNGDIAEYQAGERRCFIGLTPVAGWVVRAAVRYSLLAILTADWIALAPTVFKNRWQKWKRTRLNSRVVPKSAHSARQR